LIRERVIDRRHPVDFPRHRHDGACAHSLDPLWSFVCGP
jgi:hypothetical protein